MDDDYVDARARKGKIDHSSAGAQWIWQRFKQYNSGECPVGKYAGQILALCLASHHGGLIDCLKPDGKVGFLDRVAKSDAVHICKNAFRLKTKKS